MSDLYIGIMSGTSMDAIDVVAASFAATAQPSLHATLSVPLPNGYKDKYLQIINSGSCSLQALGELDTWTGELFADAVLALLAQNKLAASDITAIGSHGQTIWHAPNAVKPFSMQLGDPNVIAEKTKITTIADFRRSDLAAGGQGAPLAPLFHRGIFAKTGSARCIVNIGGFSNISVLEDHKYLGFDPGPGNCLMDYWVKTYWDQDFDKDGALAAQGSVNAKLLACCLDDPYFKRAAPKSAGREYFNPAWLEHKLQQSNCAALAPSDILATLLELTVVTISDAIKQNTSHTTSVYLCGGGAKNTTLLRALSANLEQQVLTTAALGIDPMWVEAALFAWLARERIANRAQDLSHITGAKHSVVLGGVYAAASQF